MSNCANVINLLFSQVCSLREREAKAGLMLDILQIGQAIIEGLDTTVYVIPNDSSTSKIPGLPLEVTVTTNGSPTTYNALLVLSRLSSNCIVYSTKTLASYGTRDDTGLFKFTSTVPITVEDFDPAILELADQQLVYAALAHCANTTSGSATVTCEDYDALLSFLYNYGVRNLNVFQATCIYIYIRDHVNPSPYEPFAPYEPAVFLAESSDSTPSVFVRQLQDTTISESVSNNESIEAKLKALLEATETTTQE